MRAVLHPDIQELYFYTVLLDRQAIVALTNPIRISGVHAGSPVKPGYQAL
ncbi:MAG: hypothetical protein AB8C46_16460 [Burkholderiaceae bacterium]